MSDWRKDTQHWLDGHSKAWGDQPAHVVNEAERLLRSALCFHETAMETSDLYAQCHRERYDAIAHSAEVETRLGSANLVIVDLARALAAAVHPTGVHFEDTSAILRRAHDFLDGKRE